jgi:hypothetical protein
MTRMIECCHPKSERWTRREKIVRADERFYTFCGRCGHWLSLGESNDADERIQIEIAAAWMANRFAPLDGRSAMTRDGWYCHRDGYMPNADTAGGWMGFLAREIATHATDSGEPPPAGNE